MTERHLQNAVVELATRYLGWWAYHTYRSTRSQPGFPDLVLIRDRVVYVELKSAEGRLSRAQDDVLGRLRRAGAEVYVWRPASLASGEVARVLAR